MDEQKEKGAEKLEEEKKVTERVSENMLLHKTSKRSETAIEISDDDAGQSSQKEKAKTLRCVKSRHTIFHVDIPGAKELVQALENFGKRITGNVSGSANAILLQDVLQLMECLEVRVEELERDKWHRV
jgi:hypothetical protein